MTTTTDTQPAMTFELRIANTLLAAGFKGGTRFTSPSVPSFHVSEGVGATVVLSWDAPEAERAEMLARYERCLTAAKLRVENRGRCLYVHPFCPPSAVVDQIVCWFEVCEGDLVAFDGKFRLLVQMWPTLLPAPYDLGVRLLHGDMAEDFQLDSNSVVAVRRYDITGEQDHG